MLTHIRKWLAPPVFEDDEDRTRAARVLNTLLVTSMLFMVFLGGIVIPFVFVEKLYNFVFALALFAAFAVARWQMKRGRVQFASVIWVSAMWIVFTILLSLAGGTISVTAVFYVASTVIAGLLLGTRAASIHALACVLAGLGMLILESSGHPLPRIFPVPATVGWVDLALSLLLTTVVLNLVLHSLNDALALARREVQERKQAEDGQRKALAEALQATHVLRESEERYRQLFEAESDAIFLIDNADGRILEANEAASAMYGYSREELLIKRNTDLSAEPEDTQRVTQETPIAEDQVVKISLRFHRKKDGTVFPVEITGRFFTWHGRSVHIAAIRDITERVRSEQERAQAEEALQKSHDRLEATLAELKDTQEQMVHQERLAAVGQLAAGIAHDFNNILATIVLYAHMSLRSADLAPEIHQRLEIIARETGRAADLVQQILDFSRRTVLERRPVALDSFTKEIIKLLQRTLPESIRVDLAFEPGEYVINADLTRIQQMIVNLALNARDAMPNGGELRIALSRTEGQEIQCVDCGPVFGGKWVRVAVTDTGTGIAPDVLPHIFEPFFTTRAPLGHGLGLSQVYGIVKQHEGHIEIETEVGQGTTFRLYWPVPATATPPVEAEEPSEVIQGLGETILVVEDNTTMRASLVDALEMLGYRILEATNGREALAVCEQHAGKIALVLSDWVMPSMGGMELVRELVSLYPAMGVLLFTGHPLSQEVKDAVPPNVVGWLLKPPSLEQLARAISQALIKSTRSDEA
jgi:PAS domain S-box-containing protein